MYRSKYLGFAHHDQLAKRLRLIYAAIVLSYVVPISTVLLLDVFGQLTWLRVLLALSPFLSLRNQVLIWYWHIRRFGTPARRHLYRMLDLDTLREYNVSINAKNSHRQRGTVVPALILCSVIGFVGWLAWWFTHYIVFLWLCSFALMVSVKAVIRRSRPPAVLLLGSSGSDISSLQLKIMNATKPLVTVACLRDPPMSTVLKETVDFFSYRTDDDGQWKQMVRSLVEMSHVVVFDLRFETSSVRYEIECVKELIPPDRLFVLKGTVTHDLPVDRCFTEGKLVEELHAFLWGPMKSLPVGYNNRRWIDRRNHYFSVAAPLGWKFRNFDDPRSKVNFYHPRFNELSLVFAVREVTDESHMPSVESLIKAQEVGLDFTVSESELLGLPWSVVTGQVWDKGHMRSWLFVNQKLHFTICFTAPTEEMLRQYLPDVRRAIDTIEILNPSVKGITTQSRQYLANRLMLARHAVSEVDIAESIRILEATRLEFAHDPSSLIQIDALLEEITNIQQSQR